MWSFGLSASLDESGRHLLRRPSTARGHCENRGTEKDDQSPAEPVGNEFQACPDGLDDDFRCRRRDDSAVRRRHQRVGVDRVQTATDTTARKIFTVDCPAGMNLTGGAAFAGTPGAVVEVVSPNITRVQVIARYDGPVTPAAAWNVVGYAICAF